jgi:tryptophanyl-tRNA synthetase
MSATPKQIKQAIMSIVTDSTPLEDPKDPDSCIVYQLYKLLETPGKVAEMADNLRAGGYGYGHAKKELLEAFNRKFEPFRERRAELADKPEMVKEILAAGAARARAEARKTLDAARHAVGLI